MKRKSDSRDALPSEKRPGISRREMVQRLVGGATGGLAASSLVAARPAHTQSTHPAKPSGENTESPGASANPSVLDAYQMETLKKLAERIVPGSTQANVAPFLDLLLSADTLENQKGFIASLSAIDGDSRRRYNSPFKNHSQNRQNEFLTAISATVNIQPSESETVSTSESASQSITHVNALLEHFENLKSWVSKAYYSSEMGMQELGWTDSYIWPTFPGCEEPKS